jgi:pyridoxal phosphate enzyme (YggS family)
MVPFTAFRVTAGVSPTPRPAIGLNCKAMEFPDLPDRLARVRETVARHQAVAGWTHPVSIIAVTKGHGPEAVRAAHAAGLEDVGENRVQEALGKQEQLRELPLRWHLVGTLQRNKARHTVGRFALVHSVDRADLAAELDRRAGPGTKQRILVQVNCSDEPQKGGAEPEGLPGLLDALREFERLEVIGLMTMSALTDDAGEQRRAFRRLRELRESAERGGHRLPELSMGMSGDFTVAVEEGATMVRLGTILFGERPQ